MSFVNPALLFGALLFAVPLIIHLLNRQRYKRREWAAMEFLLAAFKKQRRRLRRENLLLLLLRCAIPVTLALAIARPVLRQDIAAAALGSSAHHILVLDHSYSMGFLPEGAQSPHQRMQELAAGLLEGLESRPDNKVTLVLAGVRTSMPIVEDLNLGRVKARVASLTGPPDSAADLTGALGQVAELIENGPDQDVIVYLFTDLQVRAFGDEPEGADRQPPVPPAADAEPPAADPEPAAVDPDPEAEDPESLLFDDTARDLIERIEKAAEVVVLDVGGLANDASPARADNVQITKLELRTMVAVVRNALPVVVTLRNRSDTAAEVEVTLEVDGGQPTRRSAQVEAGAEGQAEFLVTFRETGPRTLRASIEGDGLSADNERFLVVPVRERIRVLIVEGSAETDPGLMDSEHLRALLDPTRGTGTADLTVFSPTVIDTIAFLQGREDPRDYDLVVLANVERLNESTASAIKDAMLSGTGLWVMLGDNTVPESFNLHLHMGEGPMPMELTGPEGYEPGGKQDHECLLLAPDHPVFSGFLEEVYKEAFQLTPIYRWIGTSGDVEKGQVLAVVRDPELSPLFVVSSHGAGKALFMTSPITLTPDRWNRFDTLMLSLPLFHETTRWLTLPQTDPYNVATGDELTASLRHRPVDVAVLLPERAGGSKILVGEDSHPLAGERFALPAFRQTDFAGIYTVEMELEAEGARRPHRERFAANPDPEEGDLSYLSHAAARELIGVETILRGLPSETKGPIQSGRSDLGVPLLYLALAVLLSEACLARFVSRRRAA